MNEQTADLKMPKREPDPFALHECSLARCALGRSCSNLRELQSAILTVPDMVLDHHMRRCALDDHFELNEFPNDLARWCWNALGDRALAEQLSLVDPYQHSSIAVLRTVLNNVLEERLWGLDHVPWCPPGLELHLMGSRLLAFDTGERYATFPALVEAFPRISARSLFYHVHEGRRRRRTMKDAAGQATDQPATDDFSAWLESKGADPMMVAQLRRVDFYFLNLSQLRREFLDIFHQYLPEPQVVTRGAA